MLHATPAPLCDEERLAATHLADLHRDLAAAGGAVPGRGRAAIGHVPTWAVPPEVHAVMPASYRVVFTRGDLAIWTRGGGSAVSSIQAPAGPCAVIATARTW